jgi:hypothetical protein
MKNKIYLDVTNIAMCNIYHKSLVNVQIFIEKVLMKILTNAAILMVYYNINNYPTENNSLVQMSSFIELKWMNKKDLKKSSYCLCLK